MIDQRIEIRTGRPSDHEAVISVMPDWWDGRDLTSMLPKVFKKTLNNEPVNRKGWEAMETNHAVQLLKQGYV